MTNIGLMFIVVNKNNNANTAAGQLCLVKIYQITIIVIVIVSATILYGLT